MSAPADQHTIVEKRAGRILAGLRVFGGAFRWLAGFILVTQEDLENAGIYLGE